MNRRRFEMRAALVKMQRHYLLDMEDAVVVTRDRDGKKKLHQATSLTTAGAVSGAFWGMLIGLSFLNPLTHYSEGLAAAIISGPGENERSGGTDAGKKLLW